MDPDRFDRISTVIGRVSRRRSLAGALGLSALVAGFGSKRAKAAAPDRNTLLAQAHAMRTGRNPFAPAAVSAAAGGPASSKSKKNEKCPKCPSCPNCDCLTRGGYVLGMTDTLCILTYPDGSIRDACRDAGMTCASTEAGCRSSESCFQQFLDTWIF
ncbi:MAG: hypothetical protein ACR2J8_01890 [Thermomicrobiales bacterium]